MESALAERSRLNKTWTSIGTTRAVCNMRTSLLLCLAIPFGIALLNGAEPAQPAAPDPELVFAEELLKKEHVVTDGPGLLAFFKARTLTQTEQDRLNAAIDKLGDDDFEVREKASTDLTAAGRLALAYLKPALEAKDIEIVCRARRCIEDINRIQESALIPAAARLLAVRRPDGATETLLACVPWLDDESTHEAVFQALVSLGLKDGVADPALIAAAKDKAPARRAAAAFVLARGNAESRQAATPLLADADARVRYHAASSLLRSGHPGAVPALIALLTDAPTVVAWQTEDLLCRLAGEKAPVVSVGPGTEAERRKAHDTWDAWWKANGDKVDLTKVNLDETVMTGTIVAELGGRVWEIGPDGKERWSFNGANSPIDAHNLPGGRVLIAEHSGQRVSERDRKGNILWQHPVTSQPVSCQRLPNGNTFIATYQDLQEVTPDHKVVYNYKSLNGMIYHAEKLRDGRFIYVTSNSTVYELDAAGKQIRMVNTNAAGNTSGWASVEKLANGNYLVALYSNSKVAELDPAGKVVSSLNAPNPGHASRLRNGNTLVANIEGRSVIEYDRDGKEVWKVQSPGRPFHAWRR